MIRMIALEGEQRKTECSNVGKVEVAKEVRWGEAVDGERDQVDCH
jgi:hypothetical protein